MIFENELIAGALIKRYKRFFVDIKVKNKVITAHCPNTGSMMGLLKKGNKVWFTKSNDTKRKLKYTLQIIEVNGSKIGVNTHLTNKIFYEALLSKKIINLKKTDILFREKQFNKNTRFDFFIKQKDKGCFIEVKNVTLSRFKNIAEFPDAVTERGLKHIRELMEAKKKGFDVELIESVSKICKIPLIVSGGLGSLADINNIKKLNINGICAGSSLHYNLLQISQIKKNLIKC